ncbi:hypothetical protein RJ639_020684 [Escallonia herrerae]|uniref:RNase H type-1 domain-containing protein n=1 Tax=Escallonia herrerae TaxID=1293975 RepID=A0AA88V6M6_9ASTE|nr:hypothetical protein RJ639_020684 [Escallonia herrerae]
MYLSSPPLLSKPLPGENLFLYLSVTDVAVSTVLIREEDGVQKPIYYINKVLRDVETRYPKIDKITLALIISARCLRPYFQSHTIIVLIDQPLRKVLLSPEASGRLVNWSIELGEFDIEYKPHTTIKAQALADFIVECRLPEEPLQLVISAAPDPWNLYVDGSSALGSSGAGLILISPEGFTIEYVICFGFQASNNEAEYEALLVGIRLVHALKVDSLSVHSDSQLVVNHVLGDYEARDERMAQYLNLVKTSAVKFQNFTIRQIPRNQNTQADTLSRLASAEETDVRHSIYLEFLKDRRELPSERHEARNLRVKAARYALVEVEIGVPTTRALHFHEVNNEAGLRANLDLLDETRTQAHERSVVIKQRVARYDNQRVRSKQFQEGDLVLRKLEVSDPKAVTEKFSKLGRTLSFYKGPQTGRLCTGNTFLGAHPSYLEC